MKNSNASFFAPKRLVFQNAAPEAPQGPAPLPNQPPKPAEGPKTPEDVMKDAQRGAEKMSQKETLSPKVEAGEIQNESGTTFNENTLVQLRGRVIAQVNARPNVLMDLNAGQELVLSFPMKYQKGGRFDCTMSIKKNPATGKADMTLLTAVPA